MKIKSKEDVVEYPQKKISDMVKNKVNNADVIDKILIEIIENTVLFKKEHYIVASKLLDIPIFDLLHSEPIEIEVDNVDLETQKFIQKSIDLFSLYSNQKDIFEGGA